MPDWEEVASSPPTYVAEMGPPAPKFASSSSSVRMGLMLGALAGDAPRGGMVDGGGVLGVALGGSSCCRPPLVAMERSVTKGSYPDTR